MPSTPRPRRRAGPLFGVGLLVVVGVLAFTPIVPPASAIDPTPSPAASADPSPDPSLISDPTPEPTPEPTPTPTPTPLPGGLKVGHVWVDDTTGDTDTVVPGGRDAPRLGATRFQVYLVRFQVLNDGDVPLDLQPVLRVGAGADPESFGTVPEVDPVRGVPFYAAADDGTEHLVRTLEISAGGLRLHASADPEATAVGGVSFWGVNPGDAVRLRAHAFTEVEFAVRATVDAAWLSTYVFRLDDGGGAYLGGPQAFVTLGPKPPVQLSPGQLPGVDVDAVLEYPLDFRTFAAVATEIPLLDGLFGTLGLFDSPHTNYTLTTDACAACHAAHTAQGPLLLRDPAPQTNLCFRCHDGSGALANTKAEFTDATVRANDPATGSWYSHPATAPSALLHATDRADEFGGQLNRHATCTDCHQPHNADETLATETTTGTGWTASGALMGASGVSVDYTDVSAGTAPTYTLNPASALEYQLCFKCHSGYTQLPAQDPAHPSRWALDKAVELNPANLSYHPIEAQGTNQTGAMAASLAVAGTSPYKLWAFKTTSTIRCVNCHGDSRKAIQLIPPEPGARLAPHAVTNRGILMSNYRNGDVVSATDGSGLKPRNQAYRAVDFALCYQCHAEAPFVDSSGDPVAESNFSLHGKHTAGLAEGGANGNLDIDVDGAGRGNALCAECHFRIHGTTNAVDDQSATSRLVNFAPNVQPYNGILRFDAATQSCTLTCHGEEHHGYSY